jgi:hypothetical protein
VVCQAAGHGIELGHGLGGDGGGQVQPVLEHIVGTGLFVKGKVDRAHHDHGACQLRLCRAVQRQRLNPGQVLISHVMNSGRSVEGAGIVARSRSNKKLDLFDISIMIWNGFSPSRPQGLCHRRA